MSIPNPGTIGYGRAWALTSIVLVAIAVTVTESNVMKNFLLKLWKDEEGAELVEWVIIVALIAVAAIATYTMLATAMSTKMTQVLAAITVP